MASETIYGLHHPLTHEICYVGKTGPDPALRLRGHLNDARKKRRTPLSAWIGSLLKDGLVPYATVLEQDPEDWREAERRWIAEYRKINPRLKNVQDGGEGGTKPGTWAALPEDRRAEYQDRMSAGRQRWLATTTAEERARIFGAAYAARREQMGEEGWREMSSRAGKASWDGVTAEERTARARRGAAARRTYKCDGCDVQTNPGALAGHQRRSGHVGRTPLTS